MATTELPAHDAGHDEHHEHPPFLAHHFDTPEQQFDSGKLGMWLFLVTEVLFFSGLFCAYAIFRAMRPDVFQFSSQFLNTTLGAINTGVLLFSSLTMAWAVRAAQKEQHRTLVGMLAATLTCAAIFLGVKAVEYSHKWDLGLLWAGDYNYSTDVPHHIVSNYLILLSIVPALCLVGVVLWAIVAKVRANAFQLRVAGPLVIVAAGYFVGVGMGMVLEGGGSEEHGEEAPIATIASDEHGEGDYAPDGIGRDPSPVPAETVAPSSAVTGTELPETALPETESGSVGAGEASDVAPNEQQAGPRPEVKARERQNLVAQGPALTGAPIEADHGEADSALAQEVDNAQLAGVFFSIYYCMTGLHAIHILGGMGVMIWLLVRAVRQDFNRQYFGPVDYVGLYWHLVDLIWIYLFPLLYLIR